MGLNDEHKINLEVLKKKENYYMKEDSYEHISPEQGIIILDKYTTTSKINAIKKELDDAWEKIDNKIQRMHLFSKKPEEKKEEENKEQEYRG